MEWFKIMRAQRLTDWGKVYQVAEYHADTFRGRYYITERLHSDGKRNGWVVKLNTHTPDSRGHHWQDIEFNTDLRAAKRHAQAHAEALADARDGRE